jgi:Sec-independent protein translocase protein TatA
MPTVALVKLGQWSVVTVIVFLLFGTAVISIVGHNLQKRNKRNSHNS